MYSIDPEVVDCLTLTKKKEVLLQSPELTEAEVFQLAWKKIKICWGGVRKGGVEFEGSLWEVALRSDKLLFIAWTNSRIVCAKEHVP